MNKLYLTLILSLLLVSCNTKRSNPDEKIITVSIAPFKYFVDQISGEEYTVNVMVPAGSDPHVYEPFPGQISSLRKSVAYISNGFLGFEMMWLERFYETNPSMVKLSLSDKIIPLESGHQHGGDHVEGADPHYWVSPVCAKTIASSVRDLLIDLNHDSSEKYQVNYDQLVKKITALDSLAKERFSGLSERTFMIYHPNLGYLARDYNLEEISVENEGKEPSPARMKELIDRASHDNIRTIFVQKEYDTKNAKAIADEVGAKVVIIDPLSEDWFNTTTDIINSLYRSMSQGTEMIK